MVTAPQRRPPRSGRKIWSIRKPSCHRRGGWKIFDAEVSQKKKIERKEWEGTHQTNPGPSFVDVDGDREIDRSGGRTKMREGVTHVWKGGGIVGIRVLESISKRIKWNQWWWLERRKMYTPEGPEMCGAPCSGEKIWWLWGWGTWELIWTAASYTVLKKRRERSGIVDEEVPRPVQQR
jgi:hypothetical protein